MLVYVMLALGLNIVVGYAGLLDLGYVAFYALGAYTVGWFASSHFNGLDIHFGSIAPAGVPGIHLGFWLPVPIAGLVAALAGVIIGWPTLRLRGDYLAIVTLGFGEIIPDVVPQRRRSCRSRAASRCGAAVHRLRRPQHHERRARASQPLDRPGLRRVAQRLDRRRRCPTASACST